MNLKSILVLVLTVGWFALCNWWYCCKLAHACAGCAPTTESVEPATDKEPLVFGSSGDVPTTGEQLETYREDVVAKMTEDNLLEITGYYYADEENNTDFENLGLARADEVRKLFVEKIPAERIRIKGSLRAGSVSDTDSLFAATDLNWIEQKTETSEVIQLADRAFILFPSASTRKEADPAIDDYLDKLAKRVKETGEKISLTGHTDNQGTEASNQQLGMARARVIRDLLVSKGVDRQQITIASKGESEPVASNETESGRHQNRRTVVRILKKDN